MSGLKSAWELSLEKTEKMVPELKSQKKLSASQKEKIAEIRKEFKAKLADLDLTLQAKIKKLPDRTPPEQIPVVTAELQENFLKEKKDLEEEMEKRVAAVRG